MDAPFPATSGRDVDGDERAARTDTTITGARGLAVLDDQERAEALRRLAVLRASDDGVPAARLARQLGLAVRTVQRWVAHYRAHGLVGLAIDGHARRAGRGRAGCPARARIAPPWSPPLASRLPSREMRPFHPRRRTIVWAM